MSLVSIQACQALFGDHYQLHVQQLHIAPLQHSVIVGANGSGKSALAALLAGQGQLQQGQLKVCEQVAWVSVAQQQALIEAEKQKDCADLLDIIAVPSTVQEILLDGLTTEQVDQGLLARLCQIFKLNSMLQRPFRALSTGETRKLLLARALLQQPQLLILDEPWDGLDQQACAEFSQLLAELSNQLTLLLVINRLSEVPDYCQQIIQLADGSIQWQQAIDGNLTEVLAHLRQLQHMQQNELSLPARDQDKFAPQPLDPKAPLVKLAQAKVAYPDKVVFAQLDWCIQAGQHWQVSGPNGSGKTCLLNLITGDHPQCYVNDIQVFGFQRGSGESIWQIKQYIGYMSNGLHLDYRVNCSLLQVILSGFYDSIGLYQTPTLNQRQLALQWLQLMALEHHKDTPFQHLSFGDQRMALIARAMVKHPALLILDEPCNGLDDLNRLKVLALIELLAREGNTTLLYVNHHSEDVIPSIRQQLCMADYQVAG